MVQVILSNLFIIVQFICLLVVYSKYTKSQYELTKTIRALEREKRTTEELMTENRNLRSTYNRFIEQSGSDDMFNVEGD